MPPVNLSPDTHWRLKTSAIIVGGLALIGAVWGLGEAWGAKAEKKEVDDLKQQIAMMDKAHALSAQEQRTMFQLIQEIRNDQKWMLQEMWKKEQAASQRPPSATPSPLNNRDDR